MYKSKSQTQSEEALSIKKKLSPSTWVGTKYNKSKKTIQSDQ